MLNAFSVCGLCFQNEPGKVQLNLAHLLWSFEGDAAKDDERELSNWCYISLWWYSGLTKLFFLSLHMYLGEATFDHNRMNEFLDAAKSIEVKEISKNVEIQEKDSD